MEQTIDFDEWFKNFKPPKPVYFAVYDPDTGAINSIFPNTGLPEIENIIELDDETAQLITEGKLILNNCFVDFESGQLEIAEIKTLNKIDDLLHRVIEKKWSKNQEEEDFFISYDTTKKKIKFELSSRYNGSRVCSSESKRKIRWDGSTVMTFLITDYNDPNYIYETIKIKINDLINQSKEFKLTNVPKKFSVYTKRLFPIYVMEIK